MADARRVGARAWRCEYFGPPVPGWPAEWFAWGRHGISRNEPRTALCLPIPRATGMDRSEEGFVLHRAPATGLSRLAKKRASFRKRRRRSEIAAADRW